MGPAGADRQGLFHEPVPAMIVKLLAFAVIGLLVWRLLSDVDRSTLKSRLRRWVPPILAIALVVLALSGHLSWLVAAVVPLAAGLRRTLPWILRAWPALAPLMRGRRRSAKRARSSADQGEAEGQGTGTAMSREEARAILGLDEDAGPADIVAAHRRLMQRNHPDRGGSDYLASRINAARDVLLRGRTN